MPETHLPAATLDELVAGHWTALLGCDAVAPSDNFFLDGGGTSLLAMRLVGALKKDTGAAVAVRWIFDHPTFGEFTAKLAAESVTVRERGA